MPRNNSNVRLRGQIDADRREQERDRKRRRLSARTKHPARGASKSLDKQYR